MKRQLYLLLFVLFVVGIITTGINIKKDIITNERMVAKHFGNINIEDYIADLQMESDDYEYNSDIRKINYTQSVQTMLEALNVGKNDIEKISKIIDTQSLIVAGGSRIQMLYKDGIDYKKHQISDILPPYIKEDDFVREITHLSFPVKDTRYIIKSNGEDGFTLQTQPVKTQRVAVYRTGKISGSLYDSFITQDIPHEVFQTFVNIYSFDIDFQRDIRNGDDFEIVYDTIVNDEGIQEGLGRVLYTKLKLKTKTDSFEYFILDRTSRDRKYYDRNGKALAKTFMKTPINGARISSKFGLRKHPILGYSKLHAGMDFAAPSGTAIYAAADGVIKFMGWNGGMRRGYGRYTIIRHNKIYSTAYAHQSRFANKLREGVSVKQGQVIGYVGSTGYSTGPHLHYEVIKDGTKINPSKVTSLSTGSVNSKERVILNRNIQFIENLIKSVKTQ